MIKQSYRITISAKKVLLNILICLIAIFIGFVSSIYNERKKWDMLIYPGVKVANIDLGGKTREEAKSLIESTYMNTKVNKDIKINAVDKAYTLQYSDLDIKHNIDEIVKSAYSYGKDMSWYKKHKLVLKGNELQYNISYKYNEEYIKHLIEAIEKDINKSPVNASIYKISEDNIGINKDVNGIRLKGEELENTIKEKIQNQSSNEITIQAPIEEIPASITSGKINSIDTKIASFSTNFSSSSFERTNNIQLAVGKINGKLLLPGDKFSFNDIVGERTKERGFKEASVIIGNKIESGLGGGICQVSSTLYNAVLRSGINSINRVHHTLPSSYVGLGFDATVDWGNIDFKFTNTLPYPIYLEGYTKDRQLYINVYSNSSLNKFKYVITNNIYETINASTKTIKDPNLPAGQVLPVIKGHNGYKVSVTRSIYENEKIISSEIVSNDFYKPVDNMVKVGIKK